MHGSSSPIQRAVSFITTGVLAGVAIAGLRAASTGDSGWIVVVAGLVVALFLILGAQMRVKLSPPVRGIRSARF